MLAHWQFLTRNHLPLVSFSVQLSDSDHLTPGGHYHPSKKPIFRAKLFGLPDAAPCPHSGRPIALNSESVLKGNSPSRSPPPPPPPPPALYCFVSQPKGLGAARGCTNSSTVKAAVPWGCHQHPFHQPGREALWSQQYGRCVSRLCGKETFLFSGPT